MAKLLGGSRIYGNLLVDAAIAAGNLSLANTTVSVSTTTGALVVAGGAGIGGNLNVAGNIYAIGSSDPVGFEYILDDISFHFDGIDREYILYVDGIPKTVNNPYQLQIYIGGVRVHPARQIYDYFNLPEINLFNRGFLIKNGLDANAAIGYGNTIVFAAAPIPSLTFEGTLKGDSTPVPAFTFKQTPFTALNIMLGS